MTKAQLDLLVLAWQAGRPEAFTLLYRFYHGKLRQFASHLLGNPAMAEDLVQNVWCKMNRRIHRLEDPRVFSSWLYKAVRWEVLDFQKTAGQQRQVPLDDDQHSECLQQHAGTEHSDLYQAMAALPAAEQLLLQLYYFHQLELVEIALILNIALGTVKSRLHRARQQLKQQLAPNNEEYNHEYR